MTRSFAITSLAWLVSGAWLTVACSNPVAPSSGGMSPSPIGIQPCPTSGPGAAAFLEVKPEGLPNLTLRGPDGGVRVALLGSALPSLLLAPQGLSPTTRITTLESGAGSIVLTDATGRSRFRAP